MEGSTVKCIALKCKTPSWLAFCKCFFQDWNSRIYYKNNETNDDCQYNKLSTGTATFRWVFVNFPHFIYAFGAIAASVSEFPLYFLIFFSSCSSFQNQPQSPQLKSRIQQVSWVKASCLTHLFAAWGAFGGSLVTNRLQGQCVPFCAQTPGLFPENQLDFSSCKLY